jgi:hypothetical protein
LEQRMRKLLLKLESLAAESRETGELSYCVAC